MILSFSKEGAQGTNTLYEQYSESQMANCELRNILFHSGKKVKSKGSSVNLKIVNLFKRIILNQNEFHFHF